MTKYDKYTAEDMMLEDSRARDRKKRQNKRIPDKIEIFSVNDLW